MNDEDFIKNFNGTGRNAVGLLDTYQLWQQYNSSHEQVGLGWGITH